MLMLALTKRNVQNRGAKEIRARREAKMVRMMKKRKRKSSHKSRKKNNNLGLKVKGCVVEVEAVEEIEAVKESQEVQKTMKNQILAVKNMKKRVERIHSLTRSLVMGLRTKSMVETEMQDLLDQRLEINFRMEKDQEITRLQDRLEKMESSKKEDHIVVEAEEAVKVVEEVAKVVEEVEAVIEVIEVAEVVEEVEVVEEAAEEAEMAQRRAMKLTRRSRRRIDNSEIVKSLTMSNSLKSPPELHRCVLSQGHPN